MAFGVLLCFFYVLAQVFIFHALKLSRDRIDILARLLQIQVSTTINSMTRPNNLGQGTCEQMIIF